MALLLPGSLALVWVYDEKAMQPWLNDLKGDPLPWLLEPENPSVRYWTLRDLLDLPEDDLTVQETRTDITNQPLVQELFARQHAQGYWGEESKPYTAQGAVAALSLLYMLGAPPDKRTARGCQSFLRFCQNEGGGFSMVKTLRSGIFPCTTGQHLPFLLYFGQGEDPHVQAAIAFLDADMSTDDALVCGRYAHRPCLWGAIATLNGLAALPPARRPSRSLTIIERLATTLLDAPYDFSGEHKRWLTFGVPRSWDLLSALKALAAHGYAADSRFIPLLQLVLARQDSTGRWLCGSTSQSWPLEKRNRPSKWVTLDVLRVLRSLR